MAAERRVQVQPPWPEPRRARLFVITSQFPAENETFIVRELTELRRRGFDLTILSLRSRPELIPDPEARALLPLVQYPPSPGRMVTEALATLVTRPGPALRGLGRALSDLVVAMRHPLLAAKQAAMIPLALALAGRLPREGGRIHAHFASVPTAVARVLAAFRGSGYSFTAHAFDIYVPENRRQLGRRIAGADVVVTCTAYNRDFLASQAWSDADVRKIVLCHHGLEIASYEPGQARAPDLIVGGASLVPKKGLDLLLRACAELRRRGIAARCVIIGDGPERARLEAQIGALGLREHVTLTGRIPHREVIGHLQRAAVLAHPSIVDRRGSMDGIPNLVLEALAVETPVVASVLSAIPEVVIDGQTGMLVGPGDVEGLTEALARVLTDPALGRRLGTAGRALVQERFELGRSGERLAGLLAGTSEAR